MNMKHFIFLCVLCTIISCNVEEKKYRFAVIQYFHETCTFCPGGDTDINDWTRMFHLSRVKMFLSPVVTAKVLLIKPVFLRMLK